jgi:PH (Pleckstrin Homology) domain-containing protein
MSTAMTSATPRYLKATYLAPNESLLRETLGTPIFYLPGPILALFVVLGLDYSILAVRFPALPPFPGLTWAFGQLPTFGQYGPANYVSFFFIALTILAVLWLGYRYARWISTVYAVTNTRVIVQRGILSRDFDQIPIPQVRGIDVHQSIADRIFGFGTVVISSEGGNRQTRLGNESWAGIPHPFDFQRLIESATQTLAQHNGAGEVAPARPPAPPSPSAHLPGPA